MVSLRKGESRRTMETERRKSVGKRFSPSDAVHFAQTVLCTPPKFQLIPVPTPAFSVTHLKDTPERKRTQTSPTYNSLPNRSSKPNPSSS